MTASAIFVLDYYDTDYFNAACTTWPELDPDHVLASHATRQAEWVIVDDDDHSVLGYACRWCFEQLDPGPAELRKVP